MLGTRTFFPHRAAAAMAVLLLALCLAAPAQAGLAQDFGRAYRDFHALRKDDSRGKYRSNWNKIERQFTSVYKASPRGPYAPKALYYIARVYEELGQRSGLDADNIKATEYYQRVVSHFPDHSWSDDCLLRRAKINLNRLDRPDRAYADLLLIDHRYEKGDMHDKAAAMLRELDLKAAESSPAKKTAVSSGATPKTATKPADKKPGTSYLEQVRFRSSDDYTRVVLDLDSEAKFKYQMLKPSEEVNRPHRLYIDLLGSRLGQDVSHEISVADGILRRIRSGQYTHETARVVLDFNDFEDYKIFHLYNPYRVVVDVYAPDKTSRLAQSLPRNKKGKEGYSAPKGSEKHMGELVEQLGLTIDTIMIDPGHGGKDPGAIAHGLKEKDITLKMAKILGRKLKKEGFKVLYTRSTDKFIPLEERTAMANVQKADLFISLHCNAIDNRSVHGLEVYSLNLARTKSAVRVAARENAVSTKRISDLQVILTDLMLNSKTRESKDLASDVQSSIVSNVGREYPIKNRDTREAPFYVLMGAKMPAILVEAGFMTNRTEARRLNNTHYLGYLTEGIVKGVKAYKKQISRYASL
ncbi:N-acetylmuramoyl-L-alanine amidase [Desulfohalovibrio reitneri]|uniref:N-acetylmuramoyl-L-alanine amidase n=1 Tax=Desulfohalovibrio reitneri TaxID=1307759 RepID=UPI0004A70A61|nr:N-acetylmuramoyl-L-alanine amidase [Desulfohalovibrio reitneri]